ncbi:MAG: thiamine phosphate synthase, partial [Bacteroidota bacterium]
MIVVTSPTAVNGEAAIINAMFIEGLELLHIRKPYAPVEAVRELIEGIDFRYHEQLALHQYHKMAPEYSIKR